MNIPLHHLAGRLSLYPQRSFGHNLRSTRRPLARLVAADCAATELPGRLASLFSLCGQAHRLCSQLALGALVPALSPLSCVSATGVQDQLDTETLREHVRRIVLDWPRLLPDTEHGAASLSAGPALASDFTLAAARAQATVWLEQHWLGQPAGPWLRAWDDRGDAALMSWVNAVQTPLARLLRRLRAYDSGYPIPHTHVLKPPLAYEQALHWQSALLRGDFLVQPQQDGQARHTGSWTRTAAGSAVPGVCTAWTLLGYRVAEVVRLCLGESRTGVLAWGAHALPQGWALGWVEMARGLLTHLVRLRDDAGVWRVQRCEVLAPTEWNFHACGIAAHGLAFMAEGGLLGHANQDEQRRIALLMAAIDPCVEYDVDWTDEGSLARDDGAAIAMNGERHA